MADALLERAEKLRHASDLYGQGDKAAAGQIAREVFESNRDLLSNRQLVQPGLSLLVVGLNWLNVGTVEANLAGWLDPSIPIAHTIPDRFSALSAMSDAIDVAKRGMAQAEADGKLSCPRAAWHRGGLT